jgi:ubiquinol-cytochrome c reductase cytochrome c1 subunit
MRKFMVFLLLIMIPVTVWGEEAKTPPAQSWSFQGPFGTYKRDEAQRGLKVFKEVCSTCHALKRISFRKLKDIGFSEAEIKAFASQHDVPDAPNDEGQILPRKGLPSDYFPSPYANEKAARAANNGAFPPDLSVIIKARRYGPDYVYALLTGYQDPPADMKLGEGQYYNAYMAGQQIAMIPPLKADLVTYDDGTPATVEQMAHDVVAFLSWAAEPEAEERKRLGLKVMLYLMVMSILMYLAKRKIWAELRH